MKRREKIFLFYRNCGYACRVYFRFICAKMVGTMVGNYLNTNFKKKVNNVSPTLFLLVMPKFETITRNSLWIMLMPSCIFLIDPCKVIFIKLIR